jgi:NAD dependent epimerase/dehydratase family enzyme
VGGSLGSGRQYFPWIHVQDLVRIFLFALDNERLHGPLNAVVPDPPTQGQFAAALGRALGKAAWLPAPGFLLRMALGEKARMLLSSQRAVPNVLKAEGFRFEYGELPKALQNLL